MSGNPTWETVKPRWEIVCAAQNEIMEERPTVYSHFLMIYLSQLEETKQFDQEDADAGYPKFKEMINHYKNQIMIISEQIKNDIEISEEIEKFIFEDFRWMQEHQFAIIEKLHEKKPTEEHEQELIDEHEQELIDEPDIHEIMARKYYEDVDDNMKELKKKQNEIATKAETYLKRFHMKEFVEP